MRLAQVHNAVMPVRLELAASTLGELSIER